MRRGDRKRENIRIDVEMVARKLDQTPKVINEEIMGMMIEHLKDALAAYRKANAEPLAKTQEEETEGLHLLWLRRTSSTSCQMYFCTTRGKPSTCYL